MPKLDAESAGVLDWYFANLEYGCATDLKGLSLNHWDQYDIYGTDGDHFILKDGYVSLVLYSLLFVKCI